MIGFPRATITFLALSAFGLAGLYDLFVEDRNFGIVSEKQAYRSAQIPADGWDWLNAKYHLNSILNLRGAQTSEAWYRDEIVFAEKHHIQHFDLALSATREPDNLTLESLVRLMLAASKPLLIHCNQGADRSGLASALYAYAIEGKSVAEASQQLSIRFGHFPWLSSRTGAMDKAFRDYVAAHPRVASTTFPSH